MTSDSPDFVHPYIPNSAPAARAEMLAAVGLDDPDQLYDAIPEDLKLKRPLAIPGPILSERDLRRHVAGLLQRNTSCEEALSFLGGGCWQHDVPAVCDEISGRAEFLSAYGGDTYADLGKYQAIFEYQSMIGELVGMEMVSAPIYDWASAATSALPMAARITGRRELLLPQTVSRELLAQLRNAGQTAVEVRLVAADPETGLMRLDDLARQLSPEVAAVYVENPSYLGVIETRAGEIAGLAHAHGALSVVGVDAISLGVLAAPADYGADIVCGETQALGVHMHYGGGLCGFIASRDEQAYVEEYPYLVVSIAPGRTPGELGFGWSSMYRTSYDRRETSHDYAGTTQWLWGITGAVYLALLGPRGLRELGEGIMQRSHHAMHRLNQLPGVRAPRFAAPHFKEFVVDFTGTGQTVRAINGALREHGIFGGHDLSAEFPELDQSALYCVTEVHTKGDIDRLVTALEEVLA